MHPYQRRMETIEMTLMAFFREMGCEFSENQMIPTHWDAEGVPNSMNLTELAIKINEALGLPTAPCSFEEFVGEQ